MNLVYEDINRIFEKIKYFDEYARNFHLTENGLERVEGLFNCGNLYAEQNFELLTRLNCAIHAKTLLHRDVDYIVRDKKVE